MKSYWDGRFEEGGLIWGENPSSTVEQAVALFRLHDVKDVLVPGAGYGRNTRALNAAGLRTIGVEISRRATELAKDFDRETAFYNASFLEIQLPQNRFDGIYCYNVLHLFRKPERFLFIERCRGLLREGGIGYFTVFAEVEPSCGRGEEVEWNTYESKPGRPAHYFTEKDLRQHFEAFDIIKTDIVSEQENHGKEGHHIHSLRTISVKKRPIA